MRFVVSAYVGTLLVLLAFAAAGGAVVLDATGPSDSAEEAASGRSFNVVSWEIRHFPEKWLYKAGDFLKGNGKGASDEDLLERFFNLTTEIRSLQADSPDLAAKEDERAFLENTVEDIIEGRITSILEDQGLTMGPPPFNDLDIVFPPFDFEFDAPPRVLVTSPRDRIALDHDDLLEPGLSLDDVTSIETEVESDGETSALVVQAGGVATYPSVVSNLRAYDDLIDIVSHEWLHQYLAFYPLGSRYFENSEARTLNESVANIGGRELARLYFERYGHLDLHPARTPRPSPSPAPGEPPFDFTKEMRDLRRQVEALLADGRTEEAEALMNKKRDEFEATGVYIRRLNQAYFAFYGSYADTPASIDPIGPKLEELLQESNSPGEFIRRAARITTRGELDELLAD